jgi:mycofactocin precursor
MCPFFPHNKQDGERDTGCEPVETRRYINVIFFGTAVAIGRHIQRTHESVRKRKENNMETENQAEVTCSEEPRILEEIQVEELAIDGICGVY